MNTEYLIHLATYLMLYSFCGWVLESVSKSVEQRKFVNSGFLIGPFCPIYGFGAIIMILCLSSLKENIFLLFLVSFFVLSIWEYIVGIFLEKVFKTKYWDYSHLKFNIQGRVCLKNSIYWGILGVIFISFIHPYIQNVIQSIPMNILLYLDSMIFMAITVDTIVSIIAVTNFNTAIEKINELSESIKEKVEELNNKTKQKIVNNEKNGIENVEKVIMELKMSQEKLKRKIYKQAIRLKKAFPSMKSDTISNFLNQKIEIKSLKKHSKKENKE